MTDTMLFSATARVTSVPITDGDSCIVIDGAFTDPVGMVEWAAGQQFKTPTGVAYPGLILDAPAPVTNAVADYFAESMRARLGGRRTLSVTVRYSLVTLPPEKLRPVQWQCHRDRLGPATHNVRLAAMVAYLFRDSQFGGTSFYRPRQDEAQTRQMIADAARMDSREFSERYQVTPGYLSNSNRYFERVAQVPAAWNRVLFYNGDLFHSGDVGAPGNLSTDARVGRLTLNGFFACRPALR